mmetsp:Transcript_32764/g.62911  ORF Transcript_32764/g.62911 Transcript_32764/m.62911 type:complete len:202 (-) Transcript_32764:1478-2083(-)
MAPVTQLQAASTISARNPARCTISQPARHSGGTQKFFLAVIVRAEHRRGDLHHPQRQHQHAHLFVGFGDVLAVELGHGVRDASDKQDAREELQSRVRVEPVGSTQHLPRAPGYCRRRWHKHQPGRHHQRAVHGVLRLQRALDLCSSSRGEVDLDGSALGVGGGPVARPQAPHHRGGGGGGGSVHRDGEAQRRNVAVGIAHV